MKKIIVFELVLMTILIAGSVGVLAKDFIENTGYVDADGDGVCDNKDGEGYKGYGHGKGNCGHKR